MWSPFTTKYIKVIDNHDKNIIKNTRFIDKIREIRRNINKIPNKEVKKLSI